MQQATKASNRTVLEKLIAGLKAGADDFTYQLPAGDISDAAAVRLMDRIICARWNVNSLDQLPQESSIIALAAANAFRAAMIDGQDFDEVYKAELAQAGRAVSDRIMAAAAQL